MYLVTVYLD